MKKLFYIVLFLFTSIITIKSINFGKREILDPLEDFYKGMIGDDV